MSVCVENLSTFMCVRNISLYWLWFMFALLAPNKTLATTSAYISRDSSQNIFGAEISIDPKLKSNM